MLPMITACVNDSLPLTTGSTCAKAARPKPIKICDEVSIYLPPFKFDFGLSPFKMKWAMKETKKVDRKSIIILPLNCKRNLNGQTFFVKKI